MNALCPEAGDLALLPPGPPLFRHSPPAPGRALAGLQAVLVVLLCSQVGIVGPDSGQDRPWLGSPCCHLIPSQGLGVWHMSDSG